MRQKEEKKWEEDLDFLYRELPRRHINLYFSMNEADFIRSINSLKKELPQLENHVIKVRIARIIASFRDAHTSINIPVHNLCPLEFYWFSDGIYAINTAESDKIMLYKKITHIDGIEMDQVIKTLSTIISHENQFYLKSMLPKYLPAIEFLYGLKIAENVDGLTFTFQNEKGSSEEWFVKSYPFQAYMEHIQTNRIKFSDDMLPLYRKNSTQKYWMEYIEETKTMYFNYNACKEMADEAVEDFVNRLIHSIEINDTQKLVIDMRNNTGGNSTLLDPFIETLKKCDKINQTGRLFVIIGRDTFSSALLNAYSLKNKTEAILVGEASGGKPNCYGEVQHFTLKNSGFTIKYSTKHYKLIEDDFILSLFPDVFKELSIQNYLDNVDPCMDYILNNI